MTALLEVADLVKHFPARDGWRKRPGAVHAVDGVSFSIAAGEALGLVGESGCGKSTTARLVARLINPTAGTIRFDGEDVTGRRGSAMQALRRDLQMVFQDPYASLNPRRTVGAIIGEPLVVHHIAPNARARRTAVLELMDQVGLDSAHYARRPAELSGGQRQRVGIARALALSPRLIVADEPVASLDVSIQAQILNLLADLRSRLGLALLFIGHDLAVVRHVSDRVAVMYLGVLVEIADSDTLYATPRHPYTAALLRAIPVPDPTISRAGGQALLTGDVPSPIDPPSGCRFHTRCPRAVAGHCDVEVPQLREHAGARVACHYPLDDDDAKARTP